VTAGGVSTLALGDDPAILYLHGGGYALGSAYGYRGLVGALVAAAHTGALLPDYRLAPEHPFPAAIEDALAAYGWLVEQRGSPSRVMLAGDSSGAALAMAVLLRLKADKQPMPAGAALLCPSIDLSGAMLTPSTGPHLLDDIARVADAYLAGHSIENPLINPLRGDLGGFPPLLIQCASGDRARPEAAALADRACEHGVDARLELYPCDTHVFHVFWSFLPEAVDALAQAGEFAREVLAADGSAAIRSG
jgi:monoterpene epsilon-lactone hydrolase